MRAKFIRGKESKEAMGVGSFRPKDGKLSADVIMDYGDKFVKGHNLKLGTTNVVENRHSTWNDVENEDGMPIKTYYYQIFFRGWVLNRMKDQLILNKFYEGLIDILEESNTNYELDKKYGNLKINITS